MSEIRHQSSGSVFANIRQEDEEGREFWYARDLAPLLDYPVWRNFVGVIGKARQACGNSGHAVEDHFDDVVKMVGIGSGAQRPVEDVKPEALPSPDKSIKELEREQQKRVEKKAP